MRRAVSVARAWGASFRQGVVDLGELGFGGSDAFSGTRSRTLHRRTCRARCAGGGWGGSYDGRGGAREIECELEGASGGALGAVVDEEVGRRLVGLLDGDHVAIPRDGASEVSYDFASVQGRRWIGCKGEEQRDGGRGWELHHPQSTIVT